MQRRIDLSALPAAPPMALASTLRVVLVDTVALAGCTGVVRRFEPLAHAKRMSPVSASPSTGIRGPIRTVAASGVEACAGAAVAASARGSVRAGAREPSNRQRTLAANAAVTCVPRTAAPEVTSERRPNRQQYRCSPRWPLLCGNMCNASVGLLEHARRNVCAAGTIPAPGAPCVMNGAARFRCAARFVALDRERQRGMRSMIAVRSTRSIAATAANP